MTIKDFAIPFFILLLAMACSCQEDQESIAQKTLSKINKIAKHHFTPDEPGVAIIIT